MKKLFIASTLLLALCSTSHAQRIGWEPIRVEPVIVSPITGSSSGYSGYNSGNEAGSSSGYRGSSGARYQYDMSNPTDRIRYSTDLDAQRRDQLSVDVRRDSDRLRGQRGGGLLND